MADAEWPRRVPAADPLKGRTELHVMEEIITAMSEHIVESGGSPRLFTREGKLVYLLTFEDSPTEDTRKNPTAEKTGTQDVLMQVDHGYLNRLIWPAAYILKAGRPAKVIEHTPRMVQSMLSSAVEWAFPINGFVDAPFLTHDHRFVTEWGYDADSGYFNRSKMVVPELTREEASETLQEIFEWFPLADDTSTANAMGLLLLPFVRTAIGGPTPAHLIKAPEASMGKTELGCLAGILGWGKPPGLTPPTPDSYTIGALLAGQPSIIMFDNVPTADRIGNAELYSVLTTEEWQGRLVQSGSSAIKRVRAIWIFTGNRLDCTAEMASRTVEISFSMEEREISLPVWNSKAPILSRVRQNRERFVGAFAYLIKSWVAAGSPSHGKRMRSCYQPWVDTVGGIIKHYNPELGEAWMAYETQSAEAVGWVRAIERWPRQLSHPDQYVYLTSVDVLGLFEKIDRVADLIPKDTRGKLSIAAGRQLVSLAENNTPLAQDAEGQWRLLMGHDTKKNQAIYAPSRMSKS